MEEYQNENAVDLSQFDQQWEKTDTFQDEFSDVPDGSYDAEIEKLELTASKAKREPMLKWTLSIVDHPTLSNRKLFRNNMIVSAENLRWLKTDLSRAGLEITKPSELQDHNTRERLIGVKLRVTVKTKGENQNIYIQKRIESSTPPAGQSPVAGGYPPVQGQAAAQQSRPASNLPPI